MFLPQTSSDVELLPNRSHSACVGKLFVLTSARLQNDVEFFLVTLTFIGPCIVTFFYSISNQMHQFLRFILSLE